MSRWQNFKIWRGKLPHWRADDVQYYATFRHRRLLNETEVNLLLRQLLRPNGRRWNLIICCVLPEVTEMIFTVETSAKGENYELSEIIERAKTKAGKEIIKKSGERFPPFFTESYDRILRDEAEVEEFWTRIFDSPVNAEIVEDSEEYAGIFIADAPSEE